MWVFVGIYIKKNYLKTENSEGKKSTEVSTVTIL